MCTAVTYRTKDFYFGRTLDLDVSYGQEVTVTPRNVPLLFREAGVLERHHAIIGMARVEEGYPLYFDAVNERGLAMAGLNFVGNARYGKPVAGADNVAHFEFIPWILGQCATVKEARGLLARLNLTDTPFSRELPPAQLHWMMADREECLVVEGMEGGLRVFPNPVGVLTNNPAFDRQMLRLNDFMSLSPEEPDNRFSPRLDLRPYSRGMGALGLPGDLSSQSRFVRAAFGRLNSVSGEGEEESVGQFFHILDTVSQIRGCCRVGEGYEITLYSSCCNADKGIYYYTTYSGRPIKAVHLNRVDLEGKEPVRYPLLEGEEIREQN